MSTTPPLPPQPASNREPSASPDDVSELLAQSLRQTAQRTLLFLGPAILLASLLHICRALRPTAALSGGLPLPLAHTAAHGPAALAVLGTFIAFLTSAVVQLLKEQQNLRAAPHRRALEAWLTGRFGLPQRVSLAELRADQPQSEEPMPPPADVGSAATAPRPAVPAAMAELELLCAADTTDRDLFYNLPTAQFCGQITNAIDLVLLEPAASPRLFEAFTASRSEKQKTAAGEFIRSGSWQNPEAIDRLRVRIANHAQRALDSLQLDAARRWKAQLLSSSLFVSTSLSLALAVVVRPPPPDWFAFLFSFDVLGLLYAAGVGGIAGALLAPTAHDLTAAIRNFGRR